MKKEYVRPIAIEKSFVANEYIAACYKIKCTTPAKDWGSENGSWTYLYDDTNKNGILDDGDTLLLHSVGFYGCNKWHKGVILDDAPEANGFVKSVFGTTKSVYWWKENLGSSSDYHVMVPGKENYETNPNAS